ncbi:MAG TPA: 1-(5-phosphoribosyl)-5-[(5-phosphoribosylamino)methylideneamino] imidazole-4-carboxamide isomerase [Sphingomonadaceae bacterium]|jgi:phosphoribosylformimino-5-aminoimidazole carboxamide ribotide isomerase|nr:1-(5-phosphoribosyl)-5-[(5-phosphoribosylamino)methylideneamino] imidazole-4-carboxamide isomerase [Sphingomonadaceae bacterium]
MIIYPAMDLMGGACVRLAQGRFDDATTYSANPADALRAFADAGATWAHVVDLDGARAGAPRQHDLLADLARAAPLRLQVAGGFRNRDQVARMFDAGVARVVIGSLAVTDPDLVRGLIADHGGDRITLALDVNLVDGEPLVATRGWTAGSGVSLWAVADRYPDARHLLVTDIARDGMLTGPNVELVAKVHQTLPHLHLQASGGVAHIGEVEEVRAASAAGIIVGKALWERRIDLGEAIRAGA